MNTNIQKKITKAATCEEAGEETYTCGVCGDTYTETIPKLNHHFVVTVVTPTCTTDGYSFKTCLRCGATQDRTDIVPAFGHSYSKVSEVSPTCCKDGYTDYKCAVCGDVYEESIAATGKHNYVLNKSKSKKATSKENGYIAYTCSTPGCNAPIKKTTVYSIKSYTISKLNTNYTGRNLTKPTVKVLDSKGKTISPSNYTLTYISRSTNKSFSTLKGIGRYKVKVTFKSTSNYQGSVYKYFSVIPPKETIRSISTGKHYVYAKWNRQSYATGYYVMIATNSKFTSNKRTYTCKGNKKISVKMANLKKGRRYYVKVCSYRNCKVDGKTQRVYGTYSATKSIVCK